VGRRSGVPQVIYERYGKEDFTLKEVIIHGRRILRKKLCLPAGAVLCAFCAGLWLEASAATKAGPGDVPPGLLFQDDLSSYTVGSFPDGNWRTDGKNRHLVHVVGISSPIGLQISAETSPVFLEPKVDARGSFVLEWRASETHGRSLCVAVKDPQAGSAWGVAVDPLGVEYFVLGGDANPFESRSVRMRASTPARSVYTEHDYLLSVREDGCDFFCDGQSLLAWQVDGVNGGIPQIVALPGTRPLVKRVRIWESSVLWPRLREHRANTGSQRVAAKTELESPLRPSKTGELEPVEEPRPFGTVFPRSPLPAATLHVVRADEIMRRHGAGLLLTLTSLQGLVNRSQPRIYIQRDANDPWAEWLKIRGDVKQLIEVLDPVQLFQKFREHADGAVVIDPRVNATINVATAIASVENLVVVHPDFASQVLWDIRHDLRGRWSCNADAYRWAYRTYWDEMNHHILACCYPLQMYAPRDYIVAFKIFPFYVSGRSGGKLPEANPRNELEFAEDLLSRTPVNIPIIGWESQSTGIGEIDAVRLFSWYGKFLVACNHSLNFSLHSGTRQGTYRQPPLKDARQIDPSKVYVCFTMSDGDNMNTWHDFFRDYFNDPARGTVPIGWTLGAGAYDIIPDKMDWYYSMLSDTGSFITAFGVGYMYPDQYGRAFREWEPIYRQFIQMSGEYMQHMGQDMLWIIFDPANDDEPGQLNRINALIEAYAVQLPWLRAILPGYGHKPYGYDYETSKFVTKAGVPVFHAIAPSRAWQSDPQTIVSELRQRIGNTRPAFANVFCFNWRISPTMIESILEKLGDEFVAVRPDKLAALYMSWLESRKERQ